MIADRGLRIADWKTVALDEVATIERSAIQPEAISQGTAYLGLEHIESGGKILGAKPVDEGELASSKFKFTAHHVLYGKLRPYLAKIACPDFTGICSTDILPILPGSNLERRFLCYFLRQPSMVDYANSRAAGANLPRLSPSALAGFEIPLPPLAEQRRIAEVLDRAEALRAKRRAALAQLDSLTQSLFLDLFGDPKANPKGWPIKTLGDLVAEFRYGSSNKSANQGKPALRIPNVAGGTIDLTNLKLVPVDVAEFERLRLRDGDLLFVRTNGNPDFVGRCAVFDSKAAATSGFAGNEFIFASYLIRARLTATNIAPVFLREYLLGDEGRRQLRSRSKTSAGQFNINTESLGAIPVPLPPTTLQREFARRVRAVEALKTAQRASLAELDALFATLQHRAFRGEL